MDWRLSSVDFPNAFTRALLPYYAAIKLLLFAAVNRSEEKLLSDWLKKAYRSSRKANRASQDVWQKASRFASTIITDQQKNNRAAAARVLVQEKSQTKIFILLLRKPWWFFAMSQSSCNELLFGAENRQYMGLLGILVHPAHQLQCLANGHGILVIIPSRRKCPSKRQEAPHNDG